MNQFTNTYFELSSALSQLESETEVGEIHGTLCGLFCASESMDMSLWLSSIFQEADANDLSVRDVKSILTTLYQSTQKQLNDPVCQFELLLPDEDDDLELQINALGDWCQGFLIGLSLGGIEDFKVLPTDSNEIVGDIVEIARAGTSYDFSDDEENENALAELIEYIRVGVMLINEELHPTKQSKVEGTTVH